MSAEKQSHQNDSDQVKTIKPLLDELIAQVEKVVAKAICACAVPRKFNEKILSLLRNEEKPSARTKKIFKYLTSLVFVSQKGDRYWAYHEIVRTILVERWLQEDEKRFRKLNLDIADFYADQKPEKHEYVYHLLAGEDPKGFQQFKDQISDANEYFRYSTAEALLRLFKEPGIRPTKTQSLYLRYYKGELYTISGQWVKAQKILTPMNKKRLPRPLKANVLARLGTVNNRLGNWSDAITFYRQALGLARDLKPRTRAWTRSGLGLIYKWQGKFKEARACHNTAAKIAETHNIPLWQSRALNNLGEIDQLTNKPGQARQQYERSIMLKKQLGDTYGLVWTYINMGSLFIELEDWDNATKFLQDGLKMAQDIESPPEEAWAIEYLGELYGRQQKFDKAKQNLRKGLSISQKSGDKYRTASIQVKLGRLYAEQGQNEPAIEYLIKGQQALKQLESYEAGMVEREIKRLEKRIAQSKK